MTGPRTASILLIGYGNTLRRDDAAGWMAVETIRRWGLPGVRVVARTQLTPELAADLAAADLVLFVDARAGPETNHVEVHRLEPARPDLPPCLAHASSPRFLLSLCQAAYGRAPAAELISIPAPDLGLGEGLSPTGAHGLQAALDVIRRRIDAALACEPGPPRVCPDQAAPRPPAGFSSPETTP